MFNGLQVIVIYLEIKFAASIAKQVCSKYAQLPDIIYIDILGK